jgi:Ser/Thr protein kinase RdoA (MazF antagonist)
LSAPRSDAERSDPSDALQALRALQALQEWESDAGLEDAQITQIESGLVHRTFRVQAGGECYALQRLNPLFSADVHENILAVTEHLSERQVTTPRLCRTRTGGLFAELGSAGRWRLLTWVEGVAHDTCGSAQRARAAGALVGRFHSALADLEHEFRPLGFPFHDTQRHLADLERALAENTEHRFHSAVSELAGSIRVAAAEWESEPLDDLPDRVVHLDLKFSNVLFDGPRASSLIDLDTVSRRPFWIELGDAWRSWCNRRAEHEPDAELDPAIFRAAAEGWLSTLEIPACPLSKSELVSLAHGLERLCVELSARFAADALEEAYFGWNPDLFESAGDQNLSRARGQLSLYRQARDTRTERLHFLLG